MKEERASSEVKGEEMSNFRFGWWTTGRDEAAVNLFKAVKEAILEGRILGDFCYCFISKREGEGPFSDEIARICREEGIPLEMLSALQFEKDMRKRDRNEWRRQYHEALYSLIGGYDCPLAVLAGYMWVLSAEICQKISAINLHPALPGGPTGTWQEVIWKLLEMDADRTGAMMHLVTPELDRGPAITFFAFPIRGKGWDELWKEFYGLRERYGLSGLREKIGEGLPLFKRIRKEGEIRELPLIVETLRSFSLGRLRVSRGQILDEKGDVLASPLDLSKEVEIQISK